jgi:hypothetical protein
VTRAVTALSLLAAWLALEIAVTIAHAEHEVYYRYTVLGYVKDTAGRPLAGRFIELVRDKTGLVYTAETDAKGLYVIVARLGSRPATTPSVSVLSVSVSPRLSSPSRSTATVGVRPTAPAKRSVTPHTGRSGA